LAVFKWLGKTVYDREVAYIVAAMDHASGNEKARPSRCVLNTVRVSKDIGDVKLVYIPASTRNREKEKASYLEVTGAGPCSGINQIKFPN
jgi:hypothetical protein